MEKRGFGVIGTGLWGEKHLSTYKHNPNAEVVAICDVDPGRAKKLAEQYDVKWWYTDYKKMLERDDIHAVSIVTPDHLHREPCVAAARAGKHILVVKPLAISVEDARVIVDEAKKAKVKLMVEFNSRWAPPFAAACDSIRKGELGRVLHGHAWFSNSSVVPLEMLKWSRQSSVIWFIGCLMIDILRWMLADEVNRVFAVSRQGELQSMKCDTPDFFEVVLEFKNGAVFVLEDSWVLPRSAPTVVDNRLEIVGSKGALSIDMSRHGALKVYTANNAVYPDVLVCPRVRNSEVGFVAECIKHFVDCVVHDSTPDASGEDGLAVTKVIAAAYESIRTGAPVNL